jgi:hypothetical protein
MKILIKLMRLLYLKRNKTTPWVYDTRMETI